MEIRKLVDPFVCESSGDRKPPPPGLSFSRQGVWFGEVCVYFLPTLHLNSHVNGGMTVKVQAHEPPKLDVIQ